MGPSAVCLEVLIATIIAWICIWALVDEGMCQIQDPKIRCVLYTSMLGASLPATGLQNHITVCGLL
jgi:hypothetical protein